MKRTLLLAAAAAALALPASALHAQAPSFGILAGASLPTGDAGDLYDTGFNVGATLGFTPAMLPVGIRIDGVFHNLGWSAGDADDLNLITATANAVVAIPTGTMTGMSPYLIGGIGLYSADPGDGADRENEFGWNVGAGLRFNLSGFSTFVEARYNGFDVGGESFNFVPISFGIMF